MNTKEKVIIYPTLGYKRPNIKCKKPQLWVINAPTLSVRNPNFGLHFHKGYVKGYKNTNITP